LSTSQSALSVARKRALSASSRPVTYTASGPPVANAPWTTPAATSSTPPAIFPGAREGSAAPRRRRASSKIESSATNTPNARRRRAPPRIRDASIPSGKPIPISGAMRVNKRRRSMSRRYRAVTYAESTTFTGTKAGSITSIGTKNDPRATVTTLAPKPSAVSIANAPSTTAASAASVGTGSGEDTTPASHRRVRSTMGTTKESPMPRAHVTPVETGTISIVVGEIDLASNLDMNGRAPVPPVFATSRMIALMEFAASQCIEPLLDEGELSVGVTVDVRHTAPTPLGVKVTATARYLGMEGKLYRFEVIASDPAGEIGRGFHERAIIDRARLLAGAERRRS
jgi:predicted thioesterase